MSCRQLKNMAQQPATFQATEVSNYSYPTSNCQDLSVSGLHFPCVPPQSRLQQYPLPQDIQQFNSILAKDASDLRQILYSERGNATIFYRVEQQQRWSSLSQVGTPNTEGVFGLDVPPQNPDSCYPRPNILQAARYIR